MLRYVTESAYIYILFFMGSCCKRKSGTEDVNEVMCMNDMVVDGRLKTAGFEPR